MTMRHIDIDDDLLETVRAYLGTKTLKETVNSALAEIAQYPVRQAIIDRWVHNPDADSSEVVAMGKALQQDRDTWLTKARSTGSTSSPYMPPSGRYSNSDTLPPVP